MSTYLDRTAVVSALMAELKSHEVRANRYYAKYAQTADDRDRHLWMQHGYKATAFRAALSVVQGLETTIIDLGDATEGDPRYTVWIAHSEFRDLTAEQVEALDIDLADAVEQ